VSSTHNDLAKAVAESAVVTVLREDGRIFTGTVKEHPTSPGDFVLHTGGRGRPPVVNADTVADLQWETA
jgi:hypothetical protein